MWRYRNRDNDLFEMFVGDVRKFMHQMTIKLMRRVDGQICLRLFHCLRLLLQMFNFDLMRRFAYLWGTGSEIKMVNRLLRPRVSSTDFMESFVNLVRSIPR